MATDVQARAQSPINDLLAAASSEEWTSARDAVEQLGDLLRGSAGYDHLDECAAVLMRLTGHPKWEVRKAVAHALLYLRHGAFVGAVTALLKDQNAFVRDTAERTMTRRTELSRADLKDEQTNVLVRLLADLEAKHGSRARQAALRVAEKNTEMVMRGVYHELVRPITPLLTAIEHAETALRRDKLDRDAVAAHLQVARSRARFLAAILDALREQVREIVPEFTAENLRALVEEAVAMLRDRVQAKVGDLAVQVDIDPALMIELSRHPFLQALSNVLANAVESYDGSPGTRRVQVDAAVDKGGRVNLRVTDWGCGMTVEALGDVFNYFSSKKPDGTGFGLPLTRKIVENVHRGTIHLASVEGKGTTVTITLPMEQEQRA